MFDFFWSLGAFVVALGILVAVHEWGHFYVARRCGVFVQRFSIGFGKAIWRKTSKSGTEYVIAAIPLGGYVRMLDERVDDVPDTMLSQAFNQKSVWQRMAIIFAGPGINFVFAVFALWCMYLLGVQTVKPVIGDVLPNSIAAHAGVPSDKEIVRINGRDVADWEAVNLELVSAIGQSKLTLETSGAGQYRLDTSVWKFDPESESALSSLGIQPFRPAVYTELAQVAPDSPAEFAGLKAGDTLLSLDGVKLATWQEWVNTLAALPNESVTITYLRDGIEQNKSIRLGAMGKESELRGYLGVVPRADAWPESMLIVHQYGLLDGAVEAIARTWRLMTLSVDMIGKLITGDVSVKNLSGPISIAQGAGTSAQYGLVYFLSFLALISVNLGIINLLPLPMLDGGHLMYFVIEAVRGKPVSEQAQEWGFKIGAILLFSLMGIALFNDIARLS